MTVDLAFRDRGKQSLFQTITQAAQPLRHFRQIATGQVAGDAKPDNAGQVMGAAATVAFLMSPVNQRNKALGAPIL
jgi:hypothetical protein